MNDPHADHISNDKIRLSGRNEYETWICPICGNRVCSPECPFHYRKGYVLAGNGPYQVIEPVKEQS